MPKVKISNAKGLVQESGSGFQQVTADGVGFHRWVEDLAIKNASHDNDVVARVGMYIPAHARILKAHIVATQLLTSDAGSVALEVHNADIAVDAASGGTEIVGEDVTGDLSLPDADLGVASDDVLYSTVDMGTYPPIDRGTNASYFQLAAKEDMSNATGTARVTVIIEWFGRPAVAL